MPARNFWIFGIVTAVVLIGTLYHSPYAKNFTPLGALQEGSFHSQKNATGASEKIGVSTKTEVSETPLYKSPLASRFGPNASRPISINSDMGTTVLAKKKQVFDCMIINNELDLVEFRLQALWDVVDFFLIGEGEYDFQSKPKPFFFAQNISRFAPYRKKLIHIQIFGKLEDPGYWGMERWNRNSLGRLGLNETGLAARGIVPHDDDLVFHTDTDTIIDPALINWLAWRTGYPTFPLVLGFVDSIFSYSWSNPVDTGTRHCAVTYHQAKNYCRDKYSGSNAMFSLMMDVCEIPNMNAWFVPGKTSGWHCSSCLKASDIVVKYQSYSHFEFANQIPETRTLSFWRNCILTGRYRLHVHSPGLETQTPRSVQDPFFAPPILEHYLKIGSHEFESLWNITLQAEL